MQNGRDITYPILFSGIKRMEDDVAVNLSMTFSQILFPIGTTISIPSLVVFTKV
ncbi:MAG: hypothetical protein ICV56_09870 [Nitrososphaeraceae archaeon]|nr:hypothetical protein [Nitrososphaeraceae archaeon]